jgi:hypothetical protein
MDEKGFYQKIRKAALSAGLVPGRVENAIDEGWPDVLLRGEDNFHAWAELKIAEGPNARISVRPEQTNWIVDHAARGGIVNLLAWNSRNPEQFWCVRAESVRRCAKEGCLAEPCYAVRHLPMLFMKWTGAYVNLQSQNPTLAKERPRVAFTPKRVVVKGAALQILRRTRLRDSGHDRGSHRPESAWWDA